MLSGKVERGDMAALETLPAKIRDKIQSVMANRASELANAMTEGLHRTADEVVVTGKVRGDDTSSLERLAKDAKRIKFEAHDVPLPQVGGVDFTKYEVTPSGPVGQSDMTPEQVGRAFEFGSAASGVPATSFSRPVLDEQRREAARDIEEIKKTR